MNRAWILALTSLLACASDDGAVASASASGGQCPEPPTCDRYCMSTVDDCGRDITCDFKCDGHTMLCDTASGRCQCALATAVPGAEAVCASMHDTPRPRFCGDPASVSKDMPRECVPSEFVYFGDRIWCCPD